MKGSGKINDKLRVRMNNIFSDSFLYLNHFPLQKENMEVHSRYKTSRQADRADIKEAGQRADSHLWHFSQRVAFSLALAG